MYQLEYRGWKDYIKVDIKEMGCDYIVWIPLAQDMVQWRGVMDRVINLQVPCDYHLLKTLNPYSWQLLVYSVINSLAKITFLSSVLNTVCE